MSDEERMSVREFISKHVNGVDFDDDEDLFAGGLVNSLFAVQLVMWVERTFDVKIAGEDLDFVNFRTVHAIGSFVARKRAMERTAWISN
jgi:acyl carrier protein